VAAAGMAVAACERAQNALHAATKRATCLHAEGDWQTTARRRGGFYCRCYAPSTGGLKRRLAVILRASVQPRYRVGRRRLRLIAARSIRYSGSAAEGGKDGRPRRFSAASADECFRDARARCRRAAAGWRTRSASKHYRLTGGTGKEIHCSAFKAWREEKGRRYATSYLLSPLCLLYVGAHLPPRGAPRCCVLPRRFALPLPASLPEERFCLPRAATHYRAPAAPR